MAAADRGDRAEDAAFFDLVLTDEPARPRPESAAEQPELASSASKTGDPTGFSSLEADRGQSDIAESSRADGAESDDQPEVAPRRGILATEGAELATAVGREAVVERDAGAEQGATDAGHRIVPDEAFHLDDPLVLDSGIRPRRAVHPIPDSSSAAVAPAADDTSWSDWYESSGHPVRRGRRALPSESEDEAIPRRARR